LVFRKKKKAMSEQHRFVITLCSNRVYTWTLMCARTSPGRYMRVYIYIYIYGNNDIMKRGFLCRTWRALKFIFPQNMEPKHSYRVQSAIYRSTKFNRYFLLKGLHKNHFLYRILHKRSHKLCSQHLVWVTHKMHRNGCVNSGWNACVCTLFIFQC
jgi:hypothetical protein